jgi:hypothetical protein
VRAIVAVEPNGPPGHSVQFVGTPEWFQEGPVELAYGRAAIPITYAPAMKDGSEITWVREDTPDAPDLGTCWKQAEPARQLPNLPKIPIAIVTSEASYHAPYDHCTVQFLQQAGVKPTWLKLTDLGIKGNSHHMMQEKNSKEIVATIYQWLEKTVPPTQ